MLFKKWNIHLSCTSRLSP